MSKIIIRIIIKKMKMNIMKKIETTGIEGIEDKMDLITNSLLVKSMKRRNRLQKVLLLSKLKK